MAMIPARIPHALILILTSESVLFLLMRLSVDTLVLVLEDLLTLIFFAVVVTDLTVVGFFFITPFVSKVIAFVADHKNLCTRIFSV